jgi:hypothetical protein
MGRSWSRAAPAVGWFCGRGVSHERRVEEDYEKNKRRKNDPLTGGRQMEKII